MGGGTYARSFAAPCHLARGDRPGVARMGRPDAWPQRVRQRGTAQASAQDLYCCDLKAQRARALRLRRFANLSCGGIVPRIGCLTAKQELFHRNFAFIGVKGAPYLALDCYSFVKPCRACGKGLSNARKKPQLARVLPGRGRIFPNSKAGRVPAIRMYERKIMLDQAYSRRQFSASLVVLPASSVSVSLAAAAQAHPTPPTRVAPLLPSPSPAR